MKLRRNLEIKNSRIRSKVLRQTSKERFLMVTKECNPMRLHQRDMSGLEKLLVMKLLVAMVFRSSKTCKKQVLTLLIKKILIELQNGS